MPYRIRHWGDHFENHKTRILKTLTWIPLPTDLGSAGYAELVGGHERGAAHFGVWVALLEMAARGNPRGHLSAGSRHYTAGSMALMCRMPQNIIEEALERLVNIGWVETWSGEDTRAPDQAPKPALVRQIKDDTGNSVGRKLGNSETASAERKTGNGEEEWKPDDEANREYVRCYARAGNDRKKAEELFSEWKRKHRPEPKP